MGDLGPLGMLGRLASGEPEPAPPEMTPEVLDGIRARIASEIGELALRTRFDCTPEGRPDCTSDEYRAKSAREIEESVRRALKLQDFDVVSVTWEPEEPLVAHVSAYRLKQPIELCVQGRQTNNGVNQR